MTITRIQSSLTPLKRSHLPSFWKTISNCQPLDKPSHLFAPRLLILLLQFPTSSSLEFCNLWRCLLQSPAVSRTSSGPPGGLCLSLFCCSVFFGNYPRVLSLSDARPGRPGPPTHLPAGLRTIKRHGVTGWRIVLPAWSTRRSCTRLLKGRCRGWLMDQCLLFSAVRGHRSTLALSLPFSQSMRLEGSARNESGPGVCARVCTADE